MKKVFALLTAASLLFICGCTSQQPQNSAVNNNSVSAILQAENRLDIPSVEDQLKWAKVNAEINRQTKYGYRTDDNGIYTDNADGVTYYLSNGEMKKDNAADMDITYKNYLSAEQCDTVESVSEGIIYYFSDTLLITQKVTSEEIVVSNFENKKINISFQDNIDDAFVFFDRIWFTVYNDDLSEQNDYNEVYDLYSCDFAGTDLKIHDFTVSNEMFFETKDQNNVMYFYDVLSDSIKMLTSADKTPETVMQAPTPEIECDDFIWNAVPVNDGFFYVTGCITKLDESKFLDEYAFDRVFYPAKSSGRVYIQKDGGMKLVYTDKKNQAYDMWIEDESVFVIFEEITDGSRFVRQFNFDGKMVRQYDLTVKSAALKRK